MPLEPSPYEVYHFHSGDMQQAFAETKEQLNDARNEKVSPLNVAVYPVDLAKDAELKTVPRDVRRIWQQKVEAGIKTPATLIVNPKGYEVHCGPLAKGDVEPFTNSPARKEIGKLLSKGHCGVFVLVLGKDNTLNKTASEAVGKLVHPNIVLAHDAGDHHQEHFLVMEFVDGVDLSELSRRVGPLPIAAACELIRQAAIGLQHAHENGLVHRDIKPSNLMLTSDASVKILDLGLALLPEQVEGSELTSTGQAMGTLDYMAPEQGGSSHDVDSWDDI